MRRLAASLLTLALVIVLDLGVASGGDGPSGFPLPKDAKASGPAPGGGGKIVVYDVPRGRDALSTELRDLLKKEGWTIESEEKSPRGSVRMVVKKDKTLIKVSIAGEGTQSAIILTLP